MYVVHTGYNVPYMPVFFRMETFPLTTPKFAGHPRINGFQASVVPTLRILLGMSFSEAGNSNEEIKTGRISDRGGCVCFGPDLP
jgi:hypothetical protein